MTELFTIPTEPVFCNPLQTRKLQNSGFLNSSPPTPILKPLFFPGRILLVAGVNRNMPFSVKSSSPMKSGKSLPEKRLTHFSKFLMVKSSHERKERRCSDAPH